MDIVEIRDGYRRMQITMNNGYCFVSAFYKDSDYNMSKDDRKITQTGLIAYERLIDELDIDTSQITTWRECLYHNENTYYVTDHVLDRLKERYGWNKKTSMRMLDKVFSNGTRAIDRKDHVAAWARLKEREQGDRIRIFTYGQYVFIVSRENVLITVYTIPNKTSAKKYYDRHKEKNHDELRQKKNYGRRVSRDRLPIPLYA